MKSTLLAGVLGACLVLAPLTAADNDRPAKNANRAQDSDMQKAIAFERLKDAAAARQARIEAKHPSVPTSDADRSAPDDTAQGKKVPAKNPPDK